MVDAIVLHHVLHHLDSEAWPMSDVQLTGTLYSSHSFARNLVTSNHVVPMMTTGQSCTCPRTTVTGGHVVHTDVL